MKIIKYDNDKFSSTIFVRLDQWSREQEQTLIPDADGG